MNMNDSDIIKLLWDAANLIVGFVGVQALVFFYKCTDKDFGDKINTFWLKFIIASFIWVSIILYIGAIIWITSWSLCLEDNKNFESIYLRAGIGRIVLILIFAVMSTITLYARQLFYHLPVNELPDNK